MKIERTATDTPRPKTGVLLVGTVGAVAVAGALWLHLGFPRPICRLRSWTGVPCPTCGTTRIFEALLNGDPLAAVLWNPLVFLGLVAFGLWVILAAARLIFGAPGWRIVMTDRDRLAAWLLVTVAALVNWAYLIWRGH